MKFLKLLVFLPVVLFSFEVEFSKKFSKDLPQDVLTTFLSVTIEDDSEMEVSTRLDVFNQKIKKYNKVEKKLGTLNIRPKYKHSKNTPYIVGYVGELRYKVSTFKAKYMHEFISMITELKENRDTNVSVNNLSWTVKEDTYNVALDLLRLESINWINRYAKNLSNDIGKICNVKKIVINKTNASYYERGAVAYSSAINSKSLAVPEANDEKININPRYVLECQ